MKTNILKILSIATIVIFLGAGVSLADGWKNENGKRGHAYAHYKHGGYHQYHYAPPRLVYVYRHYRPVVVERHYYPAPVYYAAPAPPPPSGLFFGMSVADAGSAFSFGVSGR
jgi:hypothetical protein